MTWSRRQQLHKFFLNSLKYKMYKRACAPLQINHNKLNVAYPVCNKAKYSEISRELLRCAFVAVIKSCERRDMRGSSEQND